MPKLLLFIAATVTLLAGCATQPATTVSPSATSDSLAHWTLAGKIGVTTPADRVNASIEWQQFDDNYDIELSGPLGQGRTEIFGNSNQITLNNRQQTLTSASPEALMQEQLGWKLPLLHFAHWAKGQSSPTTEVIDQQFDEAGNTLSLVQDGWQLSFSRYEPVAEWVLPTRLTAERDQVRVKLIIKRWQPN